MENLFFDAMIKGYAGDGVYKKQAQGFKQFVYQRPEWDLCLFDSYYSHPESKKGFGHTVITLNTDRSIPFWFMQYEGFYPKEVILFLKEALLVTYKNKKFVGGRGRDYLSCSLQYVNTPKSVEYFLPSSFARFRGVEVIKKTDGREVVEILGYHRYRGGLLIDQKEAL